jgi:hypothetical protein
MVVLNSDVIAIDIAGRGAATRSTRPSSVSSATLTARAVDRKTAEQLFCYFMAKVG